jgi:hypothetical protein
MWGLPVNPTALIPVTQPGDIRQDGVRQLVKRVLDCVASDETRRAYRDALENVPRVCDREGTGLACRGREVVLHGGGPPGAIKALTRAAVMAGLMPAETAASI